MIGILADDPESAGRRTVTLASSGNPRLRHFHSTSIEGCLLLVQPHHDGGFTLVKCGNVRSDQVANRGAPGETADGNQEEKRAKQFQAT